MIFADDISDDLSRKDIGPLAARISHHYGCKRTHATQNAYELSKHHYRLRNMTTTYAPR